MPVKIGPSGAEARGAACDDGAMGVGAAAAVDSISRSELDEILGAVHAGRVTLVDVLSPESYAAAHIDGAINLPVADVVARAGQLIPDRSRPIVVYCGGPT